MLKQRFDVSSIDTPQGARTDIGDIAAHMPVLTVLMRKGESTSLSEGVYEHRDPWIKWPPAHKVKTYSEHGGFCWLAWKIMSAGGVLKISKTVAIRSVPYPP